MGNPYWITLTLVVVVALACAFHFGVNSFFRYSDPRLDITASFYEKTVNNTAVNVGDVVEVMVRVGWHGYVVPEFKRNVKIVDPFPETYFSLESENETNVQQTQGYGGTYQLKLLAKSHRRRRASVELPAPRLYLDEVEVPLIGESQL